MFLQASGHINSLVNASVSWLLDKTGFFGVNKTGGTGTLVEIILSSNGYYLPCFMFCWGLWKLAVSRNEHFMMSRGRNQFMWQFILSAYHGCWCFGPKFGIFLIWLLFHTTTFRYLLIFMDKTIVSFFQTYLWGRGDLLDMVNLFSIKVIHWKLSTCRNF